MEKYTFFELLTVCGLLGPFFDNDEVNYILTILITAYILTLITCV
jgi:hypothetical protein